MVESLLKQKTGQEVDLAEQELIDCTATAPYNNYGCNGGSNSSALDYFKNVGIQVEAQYPFAGQNGNCRKPQSQLYKISQSTMLEPGSLITLLKAISMGPVAAAMYVADDFYDYKSGLYDHNAGCANANSVNHAVLAVGYDLNPAAPYILFKNSWSTSFGEGGYFKMSMDLVDKGPGPCNIVSTYTNLTASL